MSTENITDITLLESIKSRLSSTLNVLLVRDVLDYSYSKLFTIESTDSKLSLKPNLTFKNPYNKDILITELSLTFDDTFQEKGMLKIELGGVVIFENDKTGDFKLTKNLTLKFDRERKFKRDSELSFFVWNGTDKAKITTSVLVGIGD